jgi:hypothetical protein
MKGVVQLLVAGEDLLVHAALVIIPDAPALPREHGADAQQEGHLPGFEDPPLGVPERPAPTFEHEPASDVLMAQNQIATLEPADVIERGLANDGVAAISWSVAIGLPQATEFGVVAFRGVDCRGRRGRP